MQSLTPEEQALLDPLDQERMLARTQAWAAINSGTGNLAGLAAMAEALGEAFAPLPGEITLREPAPVAAIDSHGREIAQEHGRHFVLAVRPDAPRRVLLTGHMDTVYPADHAFQALTWLGDETLNGPGTADMKAGIAVIAEALAAFEAGPSAAAIGYDVMINSDEETGSLSSAPLIAELARGKHVALTYEPSTLPDGTLAHARGGSGNYTVTVRGRSAHAGRNPEDGRNAVVAAGTLAAALYALRTEDISINPARIEGGSANNVVPDFALLRFNIRPKTTSAAEEFLQMFKALIERVQREFEVVMEVHGGITRPPKPVDARAQKLFALVQATSAGLGLPIGTRPSGGVCDGNNIAACGVPVVDTMGVRGGAIHSPDEYLIVPSLLERARLSTLVLHRLASGALA